MKIIVSLLILIIGSCAFAASGLGTKVYTKYLMYEHIPKNRVNIKTQGNLLSYREKIIDKIKDRLQARLSKFEEIVQIYQEQKIEIDEFNPNYNMIHIDLNNLQNVKDAIFPATLNFKLKGQINDDIEFISLSFKSKPNDEQIKNIYFSFNKIFELEIHNTEIEKKRLTKEQKELLERIKLKDIIFQKYQTYYGIQLKKNVWVDVAFYKSLHAKYAEKFAQIQNDFKYYFYKSKDVDLAIKSKILKNLEEYIEEGDFKDLEIPFSTKFLGNKFIRVKKFFDELEITYLFAKDAKNSSLEPVVRQIISQVK